MTNSTLQKIKNYYRSINGANTNQVIIDFMYRRFDENLNSSIEEFKVTRQREMTQNEITMLRNSMLSNQNLETLYISAQDYHRQMEADIKANIKKDFEKSSTKKSILINIVSNFLYTALLAVVVIVGKDSVNDFIDLFRKEPDTIEMQKQKEKEIIEAEFEIINEKDNN